MHWGLPSGSGGASSSSVIAVALGSACVRLIDPRTRNHIQHMRWSHKNVKCVRWLTSPSHLLVAGAESGEMVVWDIRSGRAVLTELKRRDEPLAYSTNERRARPSRAHDSAVTSIRCSSDGRWMVSLSNDGRLNTWNLHTLALESTLNVGQVMLLLGIAYILLFAAALDC